MKKIIAYAMAELELGQGDWFLCLPSTLTIMPILSKVKASTMMAKSPERQLSLRMCVSPVIQK